jgi:cytochrome c551/c552
MSDAARAAYYEAAARERARLADQSQIAALLATRDRYEAALRRIAAVECHLACKSVGPSFSQCARCEAREALAAAQEDTNG